MSVLLLKYGSGDGKTSAPANNASGIKPWIGFQGISRAAQPDSLRRDNNARPRAPANAWHLRRNRFISGGSPLMRGQEWGVGIGGDAKCISTLRTPLNHSRGSGVSRLVLVTWCLSLASRLLEVQDDFFTCTSVPDSKAAAFLIRLVHLWLINYIFPDFLVAKKRISPTTSCIQTQPPLWFKQLSVHTHINVLYMYIYFSRRSSLKAL